MARVRPRGMGRQPAASRMTASPECEGAALAGSPLQIDCHRTPATRSLYPTISCVKVHAASLPIQRTDPS